MSDKKDKKSGGSPIIQVNQGSNSISIIGTTAPIDLNINQTLYSHNSEVIVPSEPQTSNTSSDKQNTRKEWPAPKEYTVAEVWTKGDGTFCLSTKTKDKYDGKVEFPLNSKRETTNQIKLMMLLCSKYPDGASLGEIIKAVYPNELNELRKNTENAKPLLKKAASISSDIRKRLRSSNINPDIIPTMGIEAAKEDRITLLVRHLNNKDEIIEEKFYTRNRTD